MIFSSEAHAGTDGRYQLVVPYANDVPGREIRPGRAYRLRSDGARGRGRGERHAGAEGARVEAPPLAD